jgi:hypothetical protein
VPRDSWLAVRTFQNLECVLELAIVPDVGGNTHASLENLRLSQSSQLMLWGADTQSRDRRARRPFS